MALIEHVWPWMRQPQGAVRVSQRWFVRPEIAWCGSAPSVIAPGRVGTIAGYTPGVGVAGLHVSGNGTAGTGITASGGDTSVRDAATFVVVFQRSANMPYAGLVSLTGQSGSNRGIYLVDASGSGHDLGIVKGGVAAMAVTAALPLDTWMCVVASWTKSSGASYIVCAPLDGSTLYRGTATHSAAMIGGDGTYCVGRVRADLSSWPGDIALAVAAFEWLPESRARELLANPWQLFAPIERRIWVPDEAPGGVPSITAVYAENITATSADYRVTLDYA